MNKSDPQIAQQLAEAARSLQQKNTGHAPTAVTVMLSEDTLVLTFHDALTPAEKALSQTPEGAAKVQEFHRQLFATSSAAMRQEIRRIAGREVREAMAEIETATGAVAYAFPTGAMVQVFLLAPESSDPVKDADSDAPDLPATV
ncbi:DUF2294 domain-containing protein [Lignipirellula cremea]|uniref:Na+-translocating membrane potential-generating system MpsC domain-containing protein n=1 Tax=Lignipirellula cremea TaxID=2528010 RepID=A0A518E4C9_9BACT|nr:DUF2294 domain-containing protein [Lignipirellula cremea]QDU98947.1 hypothetical protein Pla8534_68580 [Lignipirellula cremea]